MADVTCSLCLKRILLTERDRHLQMCKPCSEELGVVPMPRPRRPAIPCRGCNSMKFIRAIPRELSKQPENAVGADPPPQANLMSVTFAYGPPRKGMFGGVQPIDPKLGLGMLEMYICQGCGLVDWFCFDPENIPLGPQYMTEVVDYESKTGPYR